MMIHISKIRLKTNNPGQIFYYQIECQAIFNVFDFLVIRYSTPISLTSIVKLKDLDLPIKRRN